MENEVIEVVGKNVVDAVTEDTSLLGVNPDNILVMAQEAEQYLKAMNIVIKTALRITNEMDWVCIGGKYYLQETGSAKVARLWGISIHLFGDPKVEVDAEGYKTFIYTGRASKKGESVDCQGSRSMKDDFFCKTKNGIKKPDEIDERDVRKSAYTNFVNNAIKEFVPGLRNVDGKTLEEAGLDLSKIQGYTFKTGSKGGNSGKAEDSGLVCEVCGKAITQKVASFSQSKYGKCLCMDCQQNA